MNLHVRPLFTKTAPFSAHRHAFLRPSVVFLAPRIVNGGKEFSLQERKLARARNNSPLQVSRGGQENRVRCSATNNGQSSIAAGAEDWVTRYADALRLLPLAAGAAGGAVVLVNRVVWGIPAVADAGSSPFRTPSVPTTMCPSPPLTARHPFAPPYFACRFSASAQARADVICLVLAASMVLSGLSWLALRPKPQTPVALNGVPCYRMLPSLPQPVQQELNWHVRLPSSTFYTRYELFEFLPDNTQAAILQPLGDGDGVIVMGSDTIRGFTPLHQVWLGSIAEKLDASLSALQEQG
ncbi:unnamed protein product [Closterium sp. Naga37s-1]|nr:unnamed protein product [Closterium sp. Naga37s-1]